MVASGQLRKLFSSIALTAAASNDVPIEGLHVDTTSISVQGDYEGEGALEITLVYSKDHRPDLKQFLIGLAVTKQGLPILGQSLNGIITELDGRTTGYHYDDANRLAQVVTPTGGTTSYVYDGDGRRIKMVTEDQEVRYQYLGQTIAAVTDAAGTELARYTTTPGGRLISTKQQNQLYYFDLDRPGSVVGLRGENNNQVSMFAYDSFGEVTANGVEVVNPFLYTGALYDVQVGLYQMGSRFYDPRIGRFITSDAFGGFASRPATQNRYAYVVNNPVNYIDPTGHALTAWDNAHLNDDEIVELRQLIDAYDEAETAEQKAAIHARAEVIRNQYRDDDEVGRDDGYTVDKKMGCGLWRMEMDANIAGDTNKSD